MSDIRLFNTLTKKTELFKPIVPGKVGLYHCGPTVYNDAHLGNLRAYVFADILRRTLAYSGLEVTQIINITDVGHLSSDADSGEDKMTRALKRLAKPLTLASMREVGDIYTKSFVADLKALNILLPSNLPKASENIREDLVLIGELDQKGFVYKTSDGVYFDTAKFKDYGGLGGLNQDQTDSLARTELRTEKHDPRDFAVWKFNSELGWDSPWGKGFPGWHIECSAMSMKYLGDHFDIHTGGIDHIPTHHNNEIAQSVCAGHQFANVWMHSAFLIIAGSKMAKSEDNFLTLNQLIEKGYSSIAYRYLLLSAQYRTPVQWSFEALTAAQNALTKLYMSFRELGDEVGTADSTLVAQFKEMMYDDLNTPLALAHLQHVLHLNTLSNPVKRATLLEFDQVLGLDLDNQPVEVEIPEKIQKLVGEREMARLQKDWALSDTIRKKIEAQGYSVKDTAEGPLITQK